MMGEGMKPKKFEKGGLAKKQRARQKEQDAELERRHQRSRDADEGHGVDRRRRGQYFGDHIDKRAWETSKLSSVLDYDPDTNRSSARMAEHMISTRSPHSKFAGKSAEDKNEENRKRKAAGFDVGKVRAAKDSYTPYKKGGVVKRPRDGIAQRGKTKGTMR
jgi:hypothetical protein